MKVTALRAKDVNPDIVIQSVHEDAQELRELYVVGIDKDGSPRIWTTGDLSGLSLASVILHDLAIKVLNDQFVEE